VLQVVSVLGRWWVMGDCVGHTILCTKRCRCQKTKSIDLLHDKSNFIRKQSLCSLEPPFGGLGATYTVHLRKPVVNFLLVIIELFRWVLCLSCDKRISIGSRCFEGGGSLWPKISGRRGRPPPAICTQLDRPVNVLQL